jgi:hypothetical protein
VYLVLYFLCVLCGSLHHKKSSRLQKIYLSVRSAVFPLCSLWFPSQKKRAITKNIA